MKEILEVRHGFSGMHGGSARNLLHLVGAAGLPASRWGVSGMLIAGMYDGNDVPLPEARDFASQIEGLV